MGTSARLSRRMVLGWVMIVLLGALAAPVARFAWDAWVRGMVSSPGPVEPDRSGWTSEPGVVFLGVEHVEKRSYDRPRSQRRDIPEHHDHAVLRLTPMRWTPEKTELAEAFTLETRCYGPWFPRHVPLAVEQGEVFIANGRTIEHRRPFAGPGVLWTGQVDRWPSALSVFNGIVYVGGVGQVTAFDANKRGRARVILTDLGKDPLEAWPKPIDFFVRLGPRLVAIDNVMVPKFAYVFERDRAGAMRFRYRGGLPEGVNEQLTGGVEFDGAVLLTSEYGGRGGGGYRLYRSHIGPGAITSATLIHTHHRWSIADGAAGAAEPERTGPDLGGPWSGIAAAGDCVLLGAREKGILILDPDAPETATFVDLGGRCDGLLLVGQTVIALVNQPDVDEEAAEEKPASRIVAYRWDEATRALERIREETLAMHLPRIAR